MLFRSVKVAQRERAARDVVAGEIVVKEIEGDAAELDKILSDKPAVPPLPPPVPVKPS